MSESRLVTVVVDAVGGDNAPGEILAGVTLALADDPSLHIILTGPTEIIEPYAAARGSRVEAVATTEVIEMDEHPANAVRTKKDSSIVVGCRLVKEGRAQAFFSAGSTGAAMAGCSFRISLILVNDAPPRCIKFTTQPSAIMGHTSMPMYVLNITKLPNVIRPAST